MSYSVYLYFDGDCEEAFQHYLSALDGEIATKATYAEAPPEMPVKDQDADKIMHMTLTFKDGAIMGSDVLESMGEPPVKGSNFCVALSPESEAEADRLFSSLSEGGEITLPLENTFWGAYFGQCRDKFGVAWMVNVDRS